MRLFALPVRAAEVQEVRSLDSHDEKPRFLCRVGNFHQAVRLARARSTRGRPSESVNVDTREARVGSFSLR